MRVPSANLLEMERAAESAGVTLSSWLRDAANERLEREAVMMGSDVVEVEPQVDAVEVESDESVSVVRRCDFHNPFNPAECCTLVAGHAESHSWTKEKR